MDRSDIAAALIGTFAISYVVSKLIQARKKRLPPSIKRLPIVGSLPFVPEYKEWHVFFQKKAKEIGESVIGMYMGSSYLVILNDSQSVQEAFVKRSVDYSGRHVFYSSKTWINVHQKGIVDHPFDAQFLRQQKLVLSILKDFGFGKSIMETRILGEVSHLIQKIKLVNGRPFWPDSLITSSVFNVIISIVKGEREEEAKAKEMVATCHNLLQESSRLFIIDLYPVMQYLPSLGRKLGEVLEYNRQMFEYIKNIIDGSLEHSFIKNYIDRMGSDYQPEQLEYTIRDLLVGGSETGAKILLWSIYLLAGSEHGRAVQEKMRQEINSVVPRDRLPSIDDRGRLPYVQATMCEVMRIKTIAPLALPHETLCDTMVGGFHIPAHTMVLPNIYAVHMDPAEWQDPLEFRPERFLDASGNVINMEKVAVPYPVYLRHLFQRASKRSYLKQPGLFSQFTARRRSCLGEVLARQEIFLFLSSLVQNFVLQPPEGQDMIECEEDVGFTIAPSRFEVRLTELPPVE